MVQVQIQLQLRLQMDLRLFFSAFLRGRAAPRLAPYIKELSCRNQDTPIHTFPH